MTYSTRHHDSGQQPHTPDACEPSSSTRIQLKRALSSMPLAAQRHHIRPERPTFAQPIQRKANASPKGPVGNDGAGQPLPEAVQTKMEGAFGQDFSSVRVHEGPQAASVGALAYAQGENIHFAKGQYNPDSLKGQELLGHELTHVVQQRSGRVPLIQGDNGAINNDPGLEAEADQLGARAARGEQVSVQGSTSNMVQRAKASGPIQRRVGFEFEAQWNVRHVTGSDEEKAAYDDAVHDRDATLNSRLTFLRNRTRAVYAQNILIWHYRQEHADADQSAARGALQGDNASLFAVSPFMQEDEGSEAAAASVEAANGVIDSVLPEERSQASFPTEPNDPDRASTAQSMMVRSELTEAPLLGSNVPKRGHIANGAKWRLEADGSPSGGSNIEFVTAPLETLDEVRTAMDQITAFGNYLNSKAGDEQITHEQFDGKGGATAVDGMVIYPTGGAMSFEPQVTGGFKLSALPKLFKTLGPKANQKKFFEFQATANRRREGKADLNPNAGSIDQASAGATRAVKAAKGRLPAELRGDLKGLEGLIGLVANYLLNGSTIADGANAKEIAAPFLSRTHFGDNFRLLPAGLQDYFAEHPEAFIAIALDAAGMGGAGGATVYANPTERGSAGHRIKEQCPTTRQQWLTGITQGNDLLTHADTDSRRMVHKSLGAVAADAEEDMVGPAGKKELAAIVELRKCRQNMSLEELRPVALAAFDLFEQINALKSKPVYNKR